MVKAESQRDLQSTESPLIQPFPVSEIRAQQTKCEDLPQWHDYLVAQSVTSNGRTVLLIPLWWLTLSYGRMKPASASGHSNTRSSPTPDPTGPTLLLILEIKTFNAFPTINPPSGYNSLTISLSGGIIEDTYSVWAPFPTRALMHSRLPERAALWMGVSPSQSWKTECICSGLPHVHSEKQRITVLLYPWNKAVWAKSKVE